MNSAEQEVLLEYLNAQLQEGNVEVLKILSSVGHQATVVLGEKKRIEEREALCKAGCKILPDSVIAHYELILSQDDTKIKNHLRTMFGEKSLFIPRTFKRISLNKLAI